MTQIIYSIITRLIHSRRVLLILAAGIAGVLTLFVPELTPLRDELFTITAVLMLVFISGMSSQQAAGIARESAPIYADHDLRDLLREVVQEVLEEVLNTEE